jgi:hypothetical protein
MVGANSNHGILSRGRSAALSEAELFAPATYEKSSPTFSLSLALCSMPYALCPMLMVASAKRIALRLFKTLPTLLKRKIGQT